ncbi:MAG: hypothetical protein ABJB47_00925 [Actinomycetota bacterium]
MTGKVPGSNPAKSSTGMPAAASCPTAASSRPSAARLLPPGNTAKLALHRWTARTTQVDRNGPARLGTPQSGRAGTGAASDGRPRVARRAS